MSHPIRFDVLWFAFKFVPLEYQTHLYFVKYVFVFSCDLLLNLYLWNIKRICHLLSATQGVLWFAFKFVPLEYQTHHVRILECHICCCDLLLNLYLWNIKRIELHRRRRKIPLWFAFKFVPLEYQTHLTTISRFKCAGCDLLLNLYLWNIKHIYIDRLTSVN